MRTKWRILVLVAAIASGSIGVRPAAAAPATGQDDGPPAALKPQSPEVRPSGPEDEALKRLIGKRTSNKGITLSSAPATRPHKVLGAVSVEAPAPKDGADTNAGPNLYLNELLRSQAVKLYGEKNVDGIMSVRYEPAAGGKVRANGTAVHFEDATNK